MATKKKVIREIRRQDHPGHLDPAHALSLRANGEQTRNHDDERAFIGGAGAKDGLAEELAEAAVTAMTSGEDELAEELDSVVVEELGGPFVASSGRVEFALGTDASNPPGAEREPIPRT